MQNAINEFMAWFEDNLNNYLNGGPAALPGTLEGFNASIYGLWPLPSPNMDPPILTNPLVKLALWVQNNIDAVVGEVHDAQTGAEAVGGVRRIIEEAESEMDDSGGIGGGPQ